MRIKNINDLRDVVTERWSQLDDMDSRYLNDAGMAAKEAYRAVIWNIAFHESIESLAADENFQNLSSIPNKHSEYYRILRMINRAIEKILLKLEGI